MSSLRRDIKDRRIAGALLTPPRGTDSLSIRCLDTCCFLARHLLGNRGLLRRQAAATLGHLFTLSNTWAMTTDLCGYGDKWRTRTGWIDSRDRHRFEKHCFTTKGGSCSFSHSKHFSRCPLTQCSTYLALFVDALAFRLSTSSREHPSSILIRESGVGDVVSHEPSCISPCQASCSRLLFSLSHSLTQQKNLAPSTTHLITYKTALS